MARFIQYIHIDLELYWKSVKIEDGYNFWYTFKESK